MNKKFLSAILFGAMLVTAIGTFVSCKDYDDDIENLQAQINNLATKDDMTAQISSLQSSLSSAASDASAALSDAQAAQTAAQQAIADAQTAQAAAETALAAAEASGDEAAKAQTAAAAAQAAADLATATANEAKAAADAADATATLEAIATLQDQLKELQDKVDAVNESNTTAMDDLRTELLAAIAEVEKIAGANASDAITSIEFVRSYSSTDTPQSLDMEYTIAVEQDNVFEEGIDKYITFKAGDLYQVPTSFLVRVSPVNAKLTADMIHFVNSQGDNLDDIVEVTKVAKSTTLLHGSNTRAAASETGLWEVTAQLVDQTSQKDFNAATITTISKIDYPILFAVQVNNTIDGDSTRYVTSSYDLAMWWVDYEPCTDLFFFVDETPVTEINNRYTNDPSELSDSADVNPSLPYTTSDITYIEEAWADSKDKYETPATEAIVSYNTDGSINTDKSNVVQADGTSGLCTVSDNRSGKDLYPAVQGEPITISLTKTKDDKEVDEPGIRALYVTLDYQENAIESDPSEWNAWKSYSYTGLNTVVEGTTTTITINNANGVINDIIGFRVYAVNYDGTLVDPDGKAFYVSVGNTAIDWNAAATTITPICGDYTDTESTSASVTLSKLTDIDHVTWVTDEINGSTDAFTAHFYAGTSTTPSFSTDDLDAAAAADLTKITSVTTTINPDKSWTNPWTYYVDDKTYTGTLTYYDAVGHVLASIKVTMKKTLPVGMPEGFSPKTAQIVNGVYYCYLIPNVTAADETRQAGYGMMTMSEVFNYGEEDDHYSFEFGTTDITVTPTGTKTITGEDARLDVDYTLVDSETKHASSVIYTYGYISSDTKKQPYTQSYDFNTIYECVYHDSADTYSWNWATLEQLGLTSKDELPYSTDLMYGVDYLAGSSANSTDETVYFDATYFDHYIYGASKWDKIYSMLLDANESLYITEAHVTSANGVVDEYFKVLTEDGHITGFQATQTSSTTNPTAPVASTLTITMNDMYGHTIEIEFPMTVVRRAD